MIIKGPQPKYPIDSDSYREILKKLGKKMPKFVPLNVIQEEEVSKNRNEKSVPRKKL